MNMRANVTAVLAAILVVHLSGCATLFSKSTRKVKVTSTPTGAEVIVDGTPRGQTPVTIELDNRKAHDIGIGKRGHGSAVT